MDRVHQIRIPILDLGCGSSTTRHLERAIAGTDGVLRVYVNPATETAYVDVDPVAVDAWTIARVIAAEGYRPGRPYEA